MALSTRARDGGQPRRATRRVTTLAGQSLEALRDDWRHELLDSVMPFLDHRVIDREYGGFLCTLNGDGTHPDDTKDTSFQGRGLWVYSFLHSHFGRKPEHLAVARQTVELLLRAMPSGEEPWAAKLTREGRPLDAPATTIAPDVAIAEGLAEFSKASGERRYRTLAQRILLRCQRIYDRPDYAPGIVSVYNGPDPIPFPGARSQGAAMILIGAVSPMLETEPDVQLEPILRGQIDAVMRRHYNPAFRLHTELLNHDYSLPANDLAQFVYTGHAIEALGILLIHAVRARDHNLFEAVAARFRRHTEVAWDEVYGGFFRSLNNVDENRWELNKALWVQEEALAALLLLIEHTGDAWADDLFAKISSYVYATYYTDRWGSRFWISGGDRTVTRTPNLTRVEHYHHPRRLMFGVLTLDRMLAKDGKVVPLPGVPDAASPDASSS